MKKHLLNSSKAILLCFFAVIVLSACSFHEIKKQTEILDGLAQINGEVMVEVKDKGQVIVLLIRKEKGSVKLENKYSVGIDGKYVFHVLPEKYFIAAYIDVNGDEIYQDNEPASYIGSATKIPKEINIDAKDKVVAEKIIIKSIITRPTSKQPVISYPKFVSNIGRKVSLEDPMFKREYTSMGLWRPLDFIDKFGGGLFFLQEFEKGKIPVIFIHGINGTSLDWEKVISSLDREKFQPWVLYYPSGLRLDLISDYLVKAVNTLHNRYKFEQLYVVAHSMGGLVARSYVMKHTQKQNSARISLVITVNSPMNGMQSAKSGVQRSPIVVPSWRDVATDSEFLQKIHSWNWPENIPYHLFFSYKTGKGNDGVVSLASQIPLKLQTEARKIYGFNADHAGLLRDNKFISRFNSILEESISTNFAGN